MNLKTVFGFAVRLFIAFVASKLILDRLGEGSPASLLGLALLLVSGVYGLEPLGRAAELGGGALFDQPESAPQPAGSKAASQRRFVGADPVSRPFIWALQDLGAHMGARGV